MKGFHFYPHFLHAGGLPNECRDIVNALNSKFDNIVVTLGDQNDLSLSKELLKIDVLTPNKFLLLKYLKIKKKKITTNFYGYDKGKEDYSKINFNLKGLFNKYINKNINNNDVVFIHGIFNYSNFLFIKESYKKIRKRVIIPFGQINQIFTTKKGRLKKQLFLKILKKYISKTDIIWCFSEFEKKNILNIFPSVKTIVIPLAFPHPVLKLKSKKNDNFFRFVFIGRLDLEVKNLPNILSGFEKFLRQLNFSNNIIFDIIGPDWNGGKSVMEKIIKEKKLSDHVFIHGMVDEEIKNNYLINSDSLLLVSNWEGFPRTVREAVKFLLPVIVSEQSNIGDYVKKYKIGIVSGLSPDEISNSLFNMYNNINEYKNIYNFKRLSEKYNWDSIINRIVIELK